MWSWSLICADLSLDSIPITIFPLSLLTVPWRLFSDFHSKSYIAETKQSSYSSTLNSYMFACPAIILAENLTRHILWKRWLLDRWSGSLIGLWTRHTGCKYRRDTRRGSAWHVWRRLVRSWCCWWRSVWNCIRRRDSCAYRAERCLASFWEGIIAWVKVFTFLYEQNSEQSEQK